MNIITNLPYSKHFHEISSPTASRDLKFATDAGLLEKRATKTQPDTDSGKKD